MTKIRHINTKPNSHYTFENYYSRQREILALRNSSASNILSPLVVSGNAGSGVTHLLSAICNECIKQNKKAVYITSEWLMFLYNKATSGFAIGELKHDVLQHDLIAIDNIQYLYRRSASLKKFLVELILLSMKWKKQIILGCSESGKDFTRSKHIIKQIQFQRVTLKEPGSEDIFFILKNLCSREDNIPERVLYAISCYNGHIQQHINCLVSIRFQSKSMKADLAGLSIEEIREIFNISSFFPKQQLRRGYIQTQMSFAHDRGFLKYLNSRSKSKRTRSFGR